MLSDLRLPADVTVRRLHGEAAARAACRALNALALAEYGLPERGRPVPLYYVVAPEDEGGAG